jgi:hypothetical protein
MKNIKLLILILVLIGGIIACEDLWQGEGDPPAVIGKPTGTLDMAFVYRVQGIPANRAKKVDLCLAHTAEDLYKGIFFLQANVSEAITHYSFTLPPGEYFYYATVVCLCGGDSCKFAGFPGQNETIAAGGKVTVEADKINSFVTIFH